MLGNDSGFAFDYDEAQVYIKRVFILRDRLF